MLKFVVKFKDETHKVIKKAREGTFKNLGHAAATLRMFARRSIKKRKKRSTISPVGQAPYSHRGKGLKSSILFAVDKLRMSAIIGPSADIVGDSGHAHEFGGAFRGLNFQKRPFMGPALKKIESRLPSFWEASL